MRAANDGKLSRVSLYDKEGPGPGQGSYDGWSAVSGFTQRLPPLRPLLHSWTARVPQQRGVQKCAPTRGSSPRRADRRLRRSSHSLPRSRHRWALTEAGLAAAARLHAEAERTGRCACGRVAKAEKAEPLQAAEGDKRAEPPPKGLRVERLPSLEKMAPQLGSTRKEPARASAPAPPCVLACWPRDGLRPLVRAPERRPRRPVEACRACTSLPETSTRLAPTFPPPSG